MRLRRRIYVLPGRARLHAHDQEVLIDADAALLAHVDGDAPIGERRAGDVVATAPDRQRQPILLGEANGLRHILRPRRSHH